MSADFHTIIVGLGAMGSAAACHLARRGQRVLGLDQFSPPHTSGSSHGQTRIIREAYFEHPLYVPLLQRAYELWHELEAVTKESLLLTTGGLMIGSPGGEVFPGSKRSAEEHRLPHEVLTAAEVRRRFPALQPHDDQQAVWEPRAGILFPERCISAHLQAARSWGAQLHVDERVLGWSGEGRGVRVRTSRGDYLASNLLLTAGAWAQTLLPDISLPLQVERQVLFWFDAARDPECFRPDRCPIHLWETPRGELFYGFPDLGDGVKLARHHSGAITTADSVDRVVSSEDEAAMRRLAARYIPSSNGALRNAVVCLYTNTPDSHFWIDRHPGHPQVLIGSPCSGHGFKFASVMGEVLAGEVMEERSRFDLSLFRARHVTGGGSS